MENKELFIKIKFTRFNIIQILIKAIALSAVGEKLTYMRKKNCRRKSDGNENHCHIIFWALQEKREANPFFCKYHNFAHKIILSRRKTKGT